MADDELINGLTETMHTIVNKQEERATVDAIVNAVAEEGTVLRHLVNRYPDLRAGTVIGAYDAAWNTITDEGFGVIQQMQNRPRDRVRPIDFADAYKAKVHLAYERALEKLDG